MYKYLNHTIEKEEIAIVYHELVLTMIIQRDIPLKNCNEYLSKVIAKAMTFNEALKLKHKENTFKLYTFCLPSPLEEDKVYHCGRAYVFKIRSFDLQFLLYIKSALCHEDCGIKVMTAQVTPKPYRFITEITTLTPLVSTLDKKYWSTEDGILLLRDRIFSNACRKSKLVFSDFQEPVENFVEGIFQLNQKPIVIKYKDGSLLGAKVRIIVKSDKSSQQLAYTLMGAGVLEKNSLGCGFCLAK